MSETFFFKKKQQQQKTKKTPPEHHTLKAPFTLSFPHPPTHTPRKKNSTPHLPPPHKNRNCAAAILTLPTLSSRPLTFHGPSSGPPSDAGRLPILTRVRDCTLAVDMPDGQTETSSWAAVALAANLLVAACADVVLNSAYSGGYTHVGDEREGIVVALFKTGTVGVGGVGG